jgi:hypothetical protein
VIRFALLVAALFVFLGLLRMARPLLEKWWAKLGGSSPSPVEADMVRDPVCGTWIDRRLALSGRSAGGAVPVCSEKCRRELESA